MTGQVGGDDEALPGPVLEHLVAEQQALAALGHDDQQRLGQRVVRRSTGRPPWTAAGRRSASAGPAGRGRRSGRGSRRAGRRGAHASPKHPGPSRQPDRGDIEQDRARAGADRSTVRDCRGASMEDDHTSRRSRSTFMPLDHYVTLGRSGLRVSPFALGAMTFGEDPGGAGIQRRGVREDPRDLPGPGRELRRHRELLHQRPLREDPRRLLRRPPRPARARGAGVEVLHQPVPRRPQRRRRGPLVDHRPARRRPCAGCAPTTSTSTGCTTGTATPRSRRPCAPSTTWSGPARSATSASPTPRPGSPPRPRPLALLRGWTPLIALQVEYSLLARTVEGELAPLALDQGMALVPWSPLKNGFLSGKYRRGARGHRLRPHGVRRRPERGRVRRHRRRRRGRRRARHHARRRCRWPGCAPAPGTVVPIVGARRLEHLEDNLAGLDVTLSAEQLCARWTRCRRRR